MLRQRPWVRQTCRTFASASCSASSRTINGSHAAAKAKSTPSESPIDPVTKKVVPKYTDILKQIKQRRSDYELQLIDPSFIKVNKSLRPLLYSHVSREISIGDLVDSRYLGPVVVVDRNPEYTKFKVCDATGNVIEVDKFELTLRLGQISDSKSLSKSIREFLPEDAQQTGISSVLCLSHQARHFICPELRAFIATAHSISEPVLSVLDSILRELRHQDKIVNVSVFQVACEVDALIDSKNHNTGHHATADVAAPNVKSHSPVDGSIIGRLSGNLTAEASPQSVDPTVLFMVHKFIQTAYDTQVLIDRKVPGILLTVLSKKDIALIDRALQSVQISEPSESEPQAFHPDLFGGKSVDESRIQLIKRYGLGDINRQNVFYQSAALAVMRATEAYKNETLSPTLALEICDKMDAVDRSVGPHIDSYKYSFLREGFLSAASPAASIFNESMRVPDFASDGRRDVSATAYCIDEATAEEIDDAISIQTLGPLYNIQVHIADPVSSFDNLWNTSVLQDAYRRCQTAYFPTSSIPLFPLEFSSLFSLDRARRSLTVSFLCDPVNAQIQPDSVEIFPGYLKSVKSMTYDQVDELLNGYSDPNRKNNNGTYAMAKDFKKLSEIAEKLQKRRLANGAINLGLANPRIQVKNGDDDIQLFMDTPTAAKTLVAELMVTANRLLAEHLDSHGLPCIFRTQKVDLPGHLRSKLEAKKMSGSLPLDLSFELMPYMRQSSLGTSAGSHSSLGVPLYAQATSPLRRFQDILLHWQFYSGRGFNREPLTKSQLSVMAHRIQAVQSLVTSAMRQSTNFYVLKYLQSVKDEIPAIVSADPFASGQQSVYLEPYGIQGSVTPIKPLKIGTSIQCVIDNINPVTSTLNLRCI